MIMTADLIVGKEHRRLMRGCAEKSLDKRFGPEAPTRRYPACMRKKKTTQKTFRCRMCGKRRSYKLEFIKNLERNCYELQRQYISVPLTKLVVARIKLGKVIHVRP